MTGLTVDSAAGVNVTVIFSVSVIVTVAVPVLQAAELTSGDPVAAVIIDPVDSASVAKLVTPPVREPTELGLPAARVTVMVSVLVEVMSIVSVLPEPDSTLLNEYPEGAELANTVIV